MKTCYDDEGFGAINGFVGVFMYKDYFGFQEDPFSIAPDPRYLFMSNQHQEALAHLLFGVRRPGGFVLLTGEVGTGKTTVCRCFLEQLPEESLVAFIVNPRQTAVELLASICDEFRISRPSGILSVKPLVDRINAYLLQAHAAGRNPVVIIDEAQNLKAEVLEQLRLLTNLETNREKLLQIILLGQPELREILAGKNLRQLSQRITARYHLGPLLPREIPAYVQHRLSRAGVERPLFSSAALRSLYRLTGGIPRLINLVCDRALLGASVEKQSMVGRRILRQAASELQGGEREGRLLVWINCLLALALVVVLGLIVHNFFKGRPLPGLTSATSIHTGCLPPIASPEVIAREHGNSRSGFVAVVGEAS